MKPDEINNNTENELLECFPVWIEARKLVKLIRALKLSKDYEWIMGIRESITNRADALLLMITELFENPYKSILAQRIFEETSKLKTLTYILYDNNKIPRDVLPGILIQLSKIRKEIEKFIEQEMEMEENSVVIRNVATRIKDESDKTQSKTIWNADNSMSDMKYKNSRKKKKPEGLMDAIIMRDMFSVFDFIAKGVDVNSETNIFHETPLTLAMLGGSLVILRALINAGAKVDNNNKTFKLRFCGDIQMYNYEGMITELIKAGADLNIRWEGNSALDMAIHFGRLGIAEEILALEPDIELLEDALEYAKKPDVLAKPENYSLLVELSEDEIQRNFQLILEMINRAIELNINKKHKKP